MNPLEGISPAERWDYLEIRGIGDPDTRSSVIAAVGTPCADALDADECRSALESLTAAAGFDNHARGAPWPVWYWILVGTRGDEARLVATTTGELVEFLGSVDTEREAALVTYLAGSDLSCSTKVGATERGYDVLLEAGPCDPTTLLHVGADGALSEVCRGPKPEPPCVH